MCRGEGKPLHVEKQALLPIPYLDLLGRRNPKAGLRSGNLPRAFGKLEVEPLLTAMELGLIRRNGALAGIYSQVGEQCCREPPGSSGCQWVW